jgi:phage terminase Nu1 subunit (DNA packaging protein)
MRKAPSRPPTQAALAADLGVSLRTLQNWKREGIDLTDRKALQARAAASKGKLESSEDYSAAKLRKLRAEADRAEILAARERGDLIPHAAVDGMFQAWGLTVRQAFEKLGANLPPVISGRAAGEVHKLLKREFRDALQAIADSPPFRGIEEIINLKKP